MHHFEEVHEIDKYNEFIETLYMIVSPESYKKYKKNKDLQRAEEGVDQVIYKGEDNWEEILEEFKDFGFHNIDPFAKGFKKN